MHVLLYSPLRPFIEADFAFPYLNRPLRRDPRWELRDASLCGRMCSCGGMRVVECVVACLKSEFDLKAYFYDLAPQLHLTSASQRIRIGRECWGRHRRTARLC